MTTNLEIAPLERLGVLAARGPDARKFLQGQLSQDVLAIGTGRVALAGFHNPQGRALAILRLVPLADDALLLALPAEIADAVMQRLRRVVLRAKVVVGDESTAWSRVGVSGAGAAGTLAAAGLLPEAHGAGAIARHEGRIAWRYDTDPERFAVFAPAADGLPAGWALATDPAAAQRRWQAADVAAGLPQVYAATSEAFVAQMLNLDALDAVSFTKGCYTGQEVIARAHYRGRVKRRLQRFRTLGPASLAGLPPGQAITLADGRSARVADAAPLEDGRIEFLAVAALEAGAPGDEETTGDAATGASRPAPTGVASTPVLAAESLPLPYALPG